MADTQTCAVHTLIEEIQNETVMVKPYAGNLRWLGDPQPPLHDPLREVIADVRRDAMSIANAHKFDFSSWPSETTALSNVLLETGQQMMDAQIATLPYPDVVFCHRIGHDKGAMEEVHLVQERRVGGETVLTVRAYQKLIGLAPWFFCGFTAFFRYKATGTEWETEWIADPVQALDPEIVARNPGFAHGYVSAHVCFFISALAALSSRGPEIRTLPAPAKLNKQRAKKGKPPLFEYRIVEIPAWAKAKAEGLGGTHASPRLHWRRGHVRHLPAGSTTLVRPCLVGVAENGFIHKDYAVAPTPTD